MSILNPKSNRLLAIDVGTYSIKLLDCQMKDNQSEVLSKEIVVLPDDLDRDSPVALGQWLKSSLRKLNLSTRYVRLSVPNYEVFWTELVLPAGDDEETRKMIQLQLERKLPVPVDSVESDYFEMEQTLLGDRKIAVVSLKKERIDFYRQMARTAGLTIDALELSSVSFFRAARELAGESREMIAIHVGYRHSDLLFIDHKNLLFSRSSSIGLELSGLENIKNNEPANNVLQTEKDKQKYHDWLKNLANEILRNGEVFSLTHNRPFPTSMLVTGGIGHMKDFALELKQLMSRPVDIIPVIPPESVVYFLAQGLITPAQPGDPSCDFLNSKLFTPKSTTSKTLFRKAVAGAVLALVLIIIAYGFLLVRENRLNTMKAEYAKYSTMVSKADKISGDTAIIEKFKSEQNSILTILHALTRIWGDSGYLKVFGYDRTKDISIVGLAGSNQAVSELITRINTSNQFTGVKLTYIRSNKRDSSYPVEFGLSMKPRIAAIPVPASTRFTATTTGGQK